MKQISIKHFERYLASKMKFVKNDEHEIPIYKIEVKDIEEELDKMYSKF